MQASRRAMLKKLLALIGSTAAATGSAQAPGSAEEALPRQVAGSMFATPTFIVLDIPAPVAAEVIALRTRYDENMAHLPAEITIVGSSGVGTVASHQDPEALFRAIQRVGQRHMPFISAFVSMERFPGVQVFWLKPRDRAPFDGFQRSLVAEGLAFNPDPFKFTPHCTVSATVQLSPRQETELLASNVPMMEFTLSRLSVYQLSEGRASLLKSFTFAA